MTSAASNNRNPIISWFLVIIFTFNTLWAGYQIYEDAETSGSISKVSGVLVCILIISLIGLAYAAARMFLHHAIFDDEGNENE